MMGFGRVGRQVYRLALDDDRYEVVAVSDIGRPEILHHLLTKSMGSRLPVRLESNYLISRHGMPGDGALRKTRLLPADKPAEIPWDVFGADLVIFLAAAAAEPELIAATGDPIVSSDVKGCPQSILVDLKGTLKAGSKLIKVLAWHESLGHARRILDLAALYAGLDAGPAREAA